LSFHSSTVAITFITEKYDARCHVMLSLQVLLSSTSQIDKAYGYRFVWPWLGSGLLTSTGTVIETYSGIIRKVIESHSARISKVIETHSGTVIKVIEPHCDAVIEVI
jgi:hypothetical protein